MAEQKKRKRTGGRSGGGESGGGAGPLGVEDVRERSQTRKASLIDNLCVPHRNMLYARGWATEAELREIWPAPCDCLGEPRACDQCRKATKEQWWRTWRHLGYYAGRAEHMVGDTDEAEEQLQRAQRDEPEMVQVVVRGEPEEGEGEPYMEQRRVRVWPKSFAALVGFRDRDRNLQWLMRRQEALRELMDEPGELDREQVPEPMTALERIGQEATYQCRVMAAAAAMPDPTPDWDEAERRVEEDPYWQHMDVVDVARIHQAFWDLHVGRLQLVELLMPPRKPSDGPGDGDRMTWSVFGATVATRLKMPVSEWARDVTLPSTLAQVKLAQQGAGSELQEAMEG